MGGGEGWGPVQDQGFRIVGFGFGVGGSGLRV